MTTHRPWLFITPGEPAGIGPDLLIQLLAQAQFDNIVVVGSAELLEARAKKLNRPLRLRAFAPTDTRPLQQGELWLLDVPLHASCRPGQLNPANAQYVLETLQKAVRLCQQFPEAALVTGPLHKGIINQAGIPFTGHTEYLAELTHTSQVVMMLACPGLRVALATTHLPLHQVSQAITREHLRGIIQVLHQDIQRRFGIAEPRILVCGLNPHAGEGGHLGNEEITTIQPVLDELRHTGMQLTGPLPADTLFIPKYLEQADVVLAMYHDQGLPVLKHMGFGQAVNITLGLPFVRTSVDHGTALELAGTGQAHTDSLVAAIDMANQLIRPGLESGNRQQLA